jgi:hypothetical protein
MIAAMFLFDLESEVSDFGLSNVSPMGTMWRHPTARIRSVACAGYWHLPWQR